MKLKTKLPKFQGKPLIEIPEFIPQTDFLRGNFGKAFLEEYNGIVRSDYDDNSALNVLNYKDGIVKGSNSYAVVLANQILEQERLRTATQADLEKILKINALNLKEVYVDTGLVLRSEDKSNKYLAKQIREKGYKPSKNNPLVIWLNELNLENDENSHSGLKFKLLENCEPFYAPILNKDGTYSSEDIDKKTGLPKKLSGGNRYSYTSNLGLVGFLLSDCSSLNSYYNNLNVSSADGRLVVVKE